MNPIEMHVAGATVQHKGPFNEIEVLVNSEPLSADVQDKWVRPLYFGLRHDGAAEFIVKHLSEANFDLVETLLCHFGWRERTTGAHLAALLDLKELEEHIGRLLLRSDVCYAGFGYCVAIATFNTPAGVNFLNQYLSYYLKRPELFFDQNDAMAALKYLDDINGTDFLNQHMQDWDDFVKDKQGWDLEGTSQRFREYMALLLEIKDRCKKSD